MDTIPNSPLDDVKQLGAILIKRTSEQEYYRFLQIQEQCRLKWQATIAKFDQLLQEHEKCVKEKEGLVASLQHIGQLWEEEKEFRRSMESERNFYKMKLNQTYELLRTDHSFDKDCDLNKRIRIDDKNYDENNSGGSLPLSDLSNVSPNSAKQADGFENLSQEFDAFFAGEYEIQNPEGSDSETSFNSILERTFYVKKDMKKIEEKNLYESLHINDFEPNHKVTSAKRTKDVPSSQKRIQKRLHATDEPIDQKLSMPSEQKVLKVEPSIETDVQPIYERIDFSSDLDNNAYSTNTETETETIDSNDVVYATVLKPKKQHSNSVLCTSIAAPELEPKPTPQPIQTQVECQHSFQYRTASWSSVCSLCSKKFRFGILACKCNACDLLIHYDCKSQLKSQRYAKKHFISECVPKDGPSIPALIVHCVNEVETRGLSEQGIYRVSGSEKEIKWLKDRFVDYDYVPNLSNVDMHVICGCIKLYLRALREPLVPTYLWNVFSDIIGQNDGNSIDSKIQRRLQGEVAKMPKANRDTLAFMVLHLQRVATCAEVQMPISNLARVFAPTIVGYSKMEPDHAEILSETITQRNIMLHFLKIPTDYWFHFISEGMGDY